MPRTRKSDYVIKNAENVDFPGALPYRGPASPRGYATREEAEERARVVNEHYNRKYGRGIDLRVMFRPRVSP